MNVGKGHWIFAAVFFSVFLVGMIWAYTKEKPLYKLNFKGVYRIIIYMILVLGVLYLFVRMNSK